VKNITEEASKLVHLSIKKKVNKVDTNKVEIEEVMVNLEEVMVTEVKVKIEVSKDKITEKLILKKFSSETFLLKPQKMTFMPFSSKLVTSKISHY